MDRRAALRALAAAGVAAVAGCQTTAQNGTESNTTETATESATATDTFETGRSVSGWETFRGDHGHTGRVGDATGPTGLTEQWVQSLRTVDTLRVSAADGVVYAASRAGGIAAFNVADGRRLGGDLSSGRPVTTEPVLTDGWVVFGTRAGEVVGVSPGNGVDWTIQAPRPQSHDGTGPHRLDSTPILDEELHIGFSEYPSTDDANGAVARATVGDEAGFTADGWPIETRYPIRASPTKAGGRVYVRDGPDVLAVDAETGTAEFRSAVRSSPRRVGRLDRSPAVTAGTLVAGGDAIVALEAGSGDEQWTTPVEPVDGSDHTRQVYGAALADGTVYVGSADGALRALDLSTGELLWSVSTSVLRWSRPAVGQDTLVIAGNEGYESGGTQYVDRERGLAMLFDRETGEQLATVERDGLVGDPVVVGSRAVVPFGNRLVALE
ncbi:PQQ-binding-like beta-propeller repeat protein [Haloarchaeobius sp. HME9146]|uniref:outer membrane protein assembly factor BamB family protein n=1 Tax=Haloarchaeobius sp. HME9146 TaxID=2978732 RepID=UPI0021BE78D4|nr:PQQ-binding-like beta-propeller repeat protein [Haloarchaeobius sp. HME9146]MCT9098150.1 PQQ-binding-like beta-propeller repeat protein [Haloarchaeobius sp. HME9146]